MWLTLMAVVVQLKEWRTSLRARAALLGMSPQRLEDIGLTRSEIEDFISGRASKAGSRRPEARSRPIPLNACCVPCCAAP